MIDEQATGAGLSTKRAEEVFRLANTLYQDHRDVLTEPEMAALRALRDRLTDVLCPIPVAVLEEEKRKLDEKFSDRVHWYVRCGKAITWCDRRKDVPEGRVSPEQGTRH